MSRAGHHRVRVSRALIAWSLLAASLFAYNARAQEAASCSFSLSQPLRSRGDLFALSVTNGPAGAASVAVTLAGNGRAFPIDKPTYAAASTGTPARVVGKIAGSVALGAYLLDVQFDGTPCTAADPKQVLRVVPPGNPEIRLDPFEPKYSEDSTPPLPGALGRKISNSQSGIARARLPGAEPAGQCPVLEFGAPAFHLGRLLRNC